MGRASAGPAFLAATSMLVVLRDRADFDDHLRDRSADFGQQVEWARFDRATMRRSGAMPGSSVSLMAMLRTPTTRTHIAALTRTPIVRRIIRRTRS